MNELVAKIKELSNAFFMDAELQTEKGNKAAAVSYTHLTLPTTERV